MKLSKQQVMIWLRISAGLCWFFTLMGVLRLLSGFDLIGALLSVAGLWAGIALLKRSKYAAYVAIALMVYAVVSSIPLIYLFLIFPAMQGHINTPGLIDYIAIIYVVVGGSCIWALIQKDTRAYLR